MPYKLKSEPPVEPRNVDTISALFSTHQMLYDFGYRGSLTTTASDGGESGRLDMVMDDSVPVSVSVGDVILYRTTPSPHVVACISHDAFTAGYETV